MSLLKQLLAPFYTQLIIEAEVVEERTLDGVHEVFPPDSTHVHFHNRSASDEVLFGPGGIENEPGYIAAQAEGWTESDYRKQRK